MLESRKQNLQERLKENEKRRNSESKRKNSRCIEILKDIISDGMQKPTVKEIKLQESIVFLKKKIDKQCGQINFLNEELIKMAEIHKDTQSILSIEKQKNRKYQATISSGNKNLAEVKKKLVISESKAQQQEKKKEQLETRIMKYKELLRKKQLTIEQIQGKAKLQGNTESTITKQKQEISVLRERFINVKSKEDDLQEQNIMLKQANNQLMEAANKLKQESWMFKEKNQRLEEQYSELEKIYEEQQSQTQMLEMELKNTLQEREKELNHYRSKTERLTQLHVTGRDTSVYVEEIGRILKKYLKDKNLRTKVEKEILEVVNEMEDGWQQVLMKSISAYV